MISEGFLSNTSVDPRLAGLELLLAPFAGQTSAQRLGMLSSHVNQALILNGCEPPHVGSGFESMIGSYEFGYTNRNQDMQILAIIPKYVPGQGAFPIKENPRTTVVYRGNSDGKVGYFHIENYTKCMDGYGYKNNHLNQHYLSVGNYVPKEVKFSTSPAHIGSQYALGTNANAAYLSVDGVTKDAFIISKKLAKKLGSLAVKTISFKVYPDQIPLNSYGNELEYRFMPDIGEQVRQDGILCCFRHPNANTFIADTMGDSLVDPQPLHDDIYTVPYSGATIIDIDIDINRHCKSKVPENVYTQVMKYKSSINQYYLRLAEVYRKASTEGLQLTPAFNTLVTEALAMLSAEGVSVPGFHRPGKITLVKKKDPIEFLNISITYCFENKVAAGFKLSGRDGSKGVVCDIWEDEDMPVDDYGIAADYILDGSTVSNRMNPGQLYECFVHRTDIFVRRRIDQLMNQHVIPQDLNMTREVYQTLTPDWIGAWNYFLIYMSDVNVNMLEIFNSVCVTDELKQNMLKTVIKDGIYHTIPPYLDSIDSEWVLRMDGWHPAPETPVEFNIVDSYGNKRRVRTKDTICIGSKYIYCLYKIPHLKSSGVGYINQHRTPVLPSPSQRQMYPIGQTPLRAGEDEIRNLLMVLGSKVVARFVGLYANSTDAVELGVRTLLNSAKPTQVKRMAITTPHIISTNNMSAMTKHLMATTGIDITTKINPNEAKQYEQLELPER